MSSATFVESMEHIRAGTYTCAAGGTVLLFDMLLTMGDEIRLIWPSRCSLVKSLYFINRYFPVPCLLLGMYHLAGFHTNLSTNMCKLVILSQLVGQAFALVAATWLLVLRVRALYTTTPWVSYSLYAVFIITHGLTIIMSSVIVHNLWPSVAYVKEVHLCVATPSKQLALAYFPPVLCEVYLVALTIYHAKQYTIALHPLLNLRTLRPNITLPTFKRRTNLFRTDSNQDAKTTTENLVAGLTSPDPTSPTMIAGNTSSAQTPPLARGDNKAEPKRSKCIITRTGVAAAMTATPILRTLYADGFTYFIVVVGLRLWTAFTFTFADESYWYTSTYLEFGLVSTSVSRLVLHLRGAAIPRDYDPNTEIELDEEEDCECEACYCNKETVGAEYCTTYSVSRDGPHRTSTIRRARGDEEEGRVGVVSADWEGRRTVNGFPTQMSVYTVHTLSRRADEKEDARRAPKSPRRPPPTTGNPHHHHHHHPRCEKRKRRARKEDISYGAQSSVHFEPGLGSRELHTRGSIDEIGIVASAPTPRQRGKTRGGHAAPSPVHVGTRVKRDEMGRIIRPQPPLEEEEDVWNEAEGDHVDECDKEVVVSGENGAKEEWVEMHPWRGGDGFVK